MQTVTHRIESAEDARTVARGIQKLDLELHPFDLAGMDDDPHAEQLRTARAGLRAALEAYEAEERERESQARQREREAEAEKKRRAEEEKKRAEKVKAWLEKRLEGVTPVDRDVVLHEAWKAGHIERVDDPSMPASRPYRWIDTGPLSAALSALGVVEVHERGKAAAWTRFAWMQGTPARVPSSEYRS